MAMWRSLPICTPLARRRIRRASIVSRDERFRAVIATRAATKQSRDARKPPSVRRLHSCIEPNEAAVTIKLNHTIVHAHDKRASADFLSGILGLGAPVPFGPF